MKTKDISDTEVFSLPKGIILDRIHQDGALHSRYSNYRVSPENNKHYRNSNQITLIGSDFIKDL